MSKQVMFRISELTRITRELGALPERSPEELSRREAIAMLSPEIAALREKGYSLAATAKMLTDMGFDISEAALKKGLRDVARAGGKTKVGRRVGTRGGAARDPHPETTVSSVKVVQGSEDAPGTTTTPGPGQRRVPESPAAPSASTPAPSASSGQVVGVRPIEVGPAPREGTESAQPSGGGKAGAGAR